MSTPTAVAVFFLIWWITLFAVLPWGVRSQHEDGEVVPGTDPGAPLVPRLGRKLIWTTLITCVVFGVFYVVYTDRLVPLDQILKLFGLHFRENY
jgi:predicted secreted protein